MINGNFEIYILMISNMKKCQQAIKPIYSIVYSTDTILENCSKNWMECFLFLCYYLNMNNLKWRKLIRYQMCQISIKTIFEIWYYAYIHGFLSITIVYSNWFFPCLLHQDNHKKSDTLDFKCVLYCLFLYLQRF